MPNIVAAELPSFTLVHGPRFVCHAFADEIQERFKQGVILDFANPIYASTTSLFYNGDFMAFDSENPEHWRRWLPVHDSVTVETWITCHTTDLRNSLGRDILGRIFVADWFLNNYEDYVKHVIVRDFYETLDAKPLIDRFGPNAIYCVNLGPLTDNFKLPSGVRTSWIAVPEASKQVDQFILDLSQPHQLYQKSVG